MDRNMGKLKGWEMKGWAGDEYTIEGEEGGRTSCVPSIAQTRGKLGTDLVSCYCLLLFCLHIKAMHDHPCAIFRQAKEASSTSR